MYILETLYKIPLCFAMRFKNSGSLSFKMLLFHIGLTVYPFSQ
jgi:hypothetical protein